MSQAGQVRAFDNNLLDDIGFKGIIK